MTTATGDAIAPSLRRIAPRSLLRCRRRRGDSNESDTEELARIVDGRASGDAVGDGVPPGHGGFAPPPAEKHLVLAAHGVEIDQTRIEIFDLGAGIVDAAKLTLDLADELAHALDVMTKFRIEFVGVDRFRAELDPLLLELVDEASQFPSPFVDVREDAFEVRNQRVGLIGRKVPARFVDGVSSRGSGSHVRHLSGVRPGVNWSQMRPATAGVAAIAAVVVTTKWRADVTDVTLGDSSRLFL